MTTVSGPLFEGRTQHEIQVATREMEKRVSGVALESWMGNMNSSFRTQTPYYMTQVTNQEMPGQHVVHDRDVIYGEWLEGIGSRNSPKTRFPGYHSMARAYASTLSRVQEICENVLRSRLQR